MGTRSMQERCKDFASEFDSIFALATPDEQQRMRDLLKIHSVQVKRIDGLSHELGTLRTNIYDDLVDVRELEAERRELLSAIGKVDVAFSDPDDVMMGGDQQFTRIDLTGSATVPLPAGPMPSYSDLSVLHIAVVPPTVTTLSVHGIHGGFSQEDLVQLWPPIETGYNYIYLPFNIKQRRSTSYVFLNFVSWAAAEAFRRQCQGKSLQHGHRVKHLTVSTAKVQGLEANLRHCKATNVSKIHNADHLPAVFLGSMRLDFRSIIAALTTPAI